MRGFLPVVRAQYDELMAQVFGFQHFLDDHDDDWSAPGVSAGASILPRADWQPPRNCIPADVHSNFLCRNAVSRR
ncbi:hypothetical protein ABQF17_08295 [Mycolicibacterium elephantis]|uniref:Uncharacterized protein n=1 Tax=Mycolicibacterium elephantis TaxID=81858 RepID=A0A0M2ZDT3_9MYCO|nr:hypothetical protein [Mycolicibacterium elephantis]KKW63264.1 hypothetical protein AAV95_18150 [Mycolicibacterium elephantis]OBB18325.1 hypothetical protein A5762_20520 [Mycolicibacterium elephantis]ORA66300.1 hypothetical protein BST23_11405 [Mycolicibacterium elephantis]